jgi:hypothetical protein
MPVNTTNIIVGPGELFIAERTAGAYPAIPALATANETAMTAFEGDVLWNYMGATEGGVDLAYEPTYSDITIDQSKDAARLFLDSQTVNFTTQLMEATLENLIYVWGFETSTHYDGAPVGDDGISAEFKLGILGEDPCEYALTVISKGVGTQPNCVPGTEVERLFLARRAISVTGATVGLRRTEATMFPVTFRLLPDLTAPVNQEYMRIVDRDPANAGA